MPPPRGVSRARGPAPARLLFAALVSLAAPACLDELLESPYLLAPGLGEARSVSIGLDNRLLVATQSGVYAVDGAGAAERLYAGPAQAVTAHPGRVYTLHDGTVTLRDATGATLGKLPTPGAVDLLAGFDELVVLYPDRLETLAQADFAPRRAATPLRDARAVALGPKDTYLVVTETTFVAVGPDGRATELAAGLVDPRAAAADAHGRRYVVADGELWRLDETGLASVAGWLKDTRDLQFGVGGLLAAENLYIASGAGTLDYVRPP